MVVERAQPGQRRGAARARSLAVCLASSRTQTGGLRRSETLQQEACADAAPGSRAGAEAAVADRGRPVQWGGADQARSLAVCLPSAVTHISGLGRSESLPQEAGADAATLQDCGVLQQVAKQLCRKTAAFYSWRERSSAAHETAAFHSVLTQLYCKTAAFYSWWECSCCKTAAFYMPVGTQLRTPLCCKTAAFYSWWERSSAARETAAYHSVPT